MLYIVEIENTLISSSKALSWLSTLSIVAALRVHYC